MKALIVIPARLQATRLPNKPLAMIGAEPMIAHVWRRAVAAGAGPVIVAAAEQEIADVITKAGGIAVLTDPGLPSGSDRVHAAAESFDPKGEYDVVVNVQGDLPTLDPKIVSATVAVLNDKTIDISTAVSPIVIEEERTDPNVVKAAAVFAPGETVAHTLYFSRSCIPSGAGEHYHHIGLYAFRREALRRFVTLPPSGLEKRERLEQLRALEDGMRMAAALVDSIPFGVDTQADLDRARKILAG